MIELKNVTYTYPHQSEPALSNLSISVSEGEIVLCTGASGCGKSTLINLLNGLIPQFYEGHLEGSVSINGVDNSTRRISEIATDVGTLFQDPEQQFLALNVEDELAFPHEWRGESPTRIREMIDGISNMMGIKDLISKDILHLSEGEKQKTALASIILLTPKVLILDEPTANLDPEATYEFAVLLQKLSSKGMTIFVVDHRLYWLKEIANRLFILQQGKLVYEGSFHDLNQSDAFDSFGLRQMDIDDPRMNLEECSEDSKNGLTLNGLTFAYKNHPPVFQNRSFQLPFGKVIAMIGQNGAGKTTFARLITGLEKANSGEIFIEKSKITPTQLLRKSSIVLQNTDHQLHMKTVREELFLSANAAGIDNAGDRIDELLDYFDLKDLENRHPQSLSGGQKQRLVIACGIVKEPDVLILDEPTSGLDGRNMRLIASLLKKTALCNTCVLIISHDLELIELCADLKLTIAAPN